MAPDLVSSKKKGAASLLVLSSYVYAVRTKRRGVCMVAITPSGKDLAVALGFKSFAYSEHGFRRFFCWSKTGDLKFETVTKRLHLGNATDTIVADVCSRYGISKNAAHKVLQRC
jgi:hypothetical protein